MMNTLSQGYPWLSISVHSGAKTNNCNFRIQNGNADPADLGCLIHLAKYDDSKHYTDIQAISEGERQSFARNYEISLPQFSSCEERPLLQAGELFE